MVLKRAAVVAAVGLLSHLAVVYGLLPDGAGDLVVERVGMTLDALAVIVGLFYVQAGTTPADPSLAPRSSDGQAYVVTSALHGRAGESDVYTTSPYPAGTDRQPFDG